MVDQLRVVGAGAEGMDEMQPLLDDSFVQWALIRFNVGQGTLQRQKVLFLHINGEECPPLVRGRANGLTPEVQVILRGGEGKDGIHATLEVKRKEDATIAHVVKELGKVFVTDSGDYDVQAYIKDLENSTPQRGSPRRSTMRASEGGRSTRSYKVANMFKDGRKALKAVGEPLGPWNWVFLGPDPDNLPIVAGGNGSVDEMTDCLSSHQAEVMYGLLRLGFGEGRLRRTKYVFVHAVGPEASAVTRARHTAQKPKMEKVIRSFVICSAAAEVATPEDLTLEDVIARVRRAAIVDDDVIAGDAPETSIFSVEAFRKALAEEQKAADEDDECGERVPGTWYSVDEAVKLIHTPSGPLNWALFAPDENWLHRRKTVAGASPTRQSMAAPHAVRQSTLAPPTGGSSESRPSSQPPPVRDSMKAARPLEGEDEPGRQPSKPSAGGEEHMGRKASIRGGSVPARRKSSAERERMQTSLEAATKAEEQPPKPEEQQTAPAVKETQAEATKPVEKVPAAIIPDVKAQDTSASGTKVRLAGPLLKMSGSFFGGWQLRWCEVSNGAIHWWERPEQAKAGEEPNGGLELRGLKVSMQRNSNSVFILHAENDKGKDYFLDANVASALAKAGWEAAELALGVTLAASDWVRALEQEAVLRRRVE
mmetsp:Transcript_32206/g.75621  ORF Transcript_32206/g.75621 Transcript_32206/m.75621 type:complete len:651 (+) Transcript_32206:106-2058(+)